MKIVKMPLEEPKGKGKLAAKINWDTRRASV